MAAVRSRIGIQESEQLTSTTTYVVSPHPLALQPLADHLRGFLRTDTCVGCGDTGVVLITPQAMPDLSDHPSGDRIAEVFEDAIAKGNPSIKANFWGYYASRLPVAAFEFTVSRHCDGPDDVLGDDQGNLIGDCWSGFQKIDVLSPPHEISVSELESALSPSFCLQVFPAI